MRGRRKGSRNPKPGTQYSVRAETLSGHTGEIGLTIDERQAYTWADRYHQKTHCRVWIVDLDTGLTIYTQKAERVAAAMGGAA